MCAHCSCWTEEASSQALADEEDAVIADAVRFLAATVALGQLRRRAILKVVSKVGSSRVT